MELRMISSKLSNTRSRVNGIKDDLIQVVDAGSKVIDEIGSGTDNHNNAYNFDFVNNINKLKLTVNGEALAKAKVAAESGETARYNFGTAEDPTSLSCTIIRTVQL